VPALRDYALCRKLKLSWSELQVMPEDTVDLWEAIWAGEQQAGHTGAT